MFFFIFSTFFRCMCVSLFSFFYAFSFLPFRYFLSFAYFLYVIFVLSLMPLLIFVQGIIKNKIKTLIWLSFVLLLYFTISIYKLSIPSPKLFDMIELILCVSLFICACLNARVRQKHGIEWRSLGRVRSSNL